MGRFARAWAAAACCAATAACATGAPRRGSGSTAAPAPSRSAARAPTSSPSGARRSPSETLAAAEQQWAKGNQEDAIRLWEEVAGQLADPTQVWMRAARARRSRLDPADATPGEFERDAKACAEDARKAWSALYPSAAAARAKGKADAAARIGRDGVEALYLEAVCDAAAARARGFTPLVERRADVVDWLNRVVELAPELDESGADRELGRLLAALPASAGGDLRAAKRHLHAAIARSPESVRNHIVYARSVAVKEQDRAMFEAQLREALRLSPDDPEAKDLLAREDELFGPAEAAQPIPGGPTR